MEGVGGLEGGEFGLGVFVEEGEFGVPFGVETL